MSNNSFGLHAVLYDQFEITARRKIAPCFSSLEAANMGADVLPSINELLCSRVNARNLVGKDFREVSDGVAEIADKEVTDRVDNLRRIIVVRTECR